MSAETWRVVHTKTSRNPCTNPRQKQTDLSTFSSGYERGVVLSTPSSSCVVEPPTKKSPVGKHERGIKCLWSLDSICEHYCWKHSGGTALRCDGHETTCAGYHEKIMWRFSSLDALLARRDELTALSLQERERMIELRPGGRHPDD